MNREILDRGDMLNGASLSFLGGYVKRVMILQGTATKVFTTGFVAVFAHLVHAFSELMWVVIILIMIDFGLGVLRALRDSRVKMTWAESLNSIIKIFVVLLGVLGVFALSELVEKITGVQTHDLFSTLFLASVGVGESVSILNHLVYHFPAFGKAADKIKSLVEKGVDDAQD